MNKDKVVIGLNFKYFTPAFVTSMIAAISMIVFPYVSVDGITVRAFGTLKKVMESGNGGNLSVIMLVGIIAVLANALLAIINWLKPSKLVAKLWYIFGIIQCFCFTVLVFGSKIMFDNAAFLPAKFMVKNLGIGFWLLLIASYVSLWYSMRVSRVNPGYIVLVIMSVIWLFPILWIVLTSLRAEQGYYVGYFIPKGFTLSNYTNLFAKNSVIPFLKWWLNTFVVACFVCVFNTLIVLATAFVLSRTRFRGRTAFMRVMLVIGMFPGFMSMIAVYYILKGLGLGQSLVSLIVVMVAGAATGYYVCKGFFDTIPRALDEAAIIDGANRWQIFTRITIPLSKSIIVYTALTSFLTVWSDFIFPSMLFGDNQASYTVAVGLNWLTDFRRIDYYYTQFAAGSILVALPIVILFIALQGFYVEGLSGSVKG